MATAQEIIAKAIGQGVDAFRAALIRQAEIHDDAAALTRNALARRGAEAARSACLAAYDIAGGNRDNAGEAARWICQDIGQGVVALNVACRILDLPAHVRTQAAISLNRD